ncbi:MAG: GTP 3',8-cyclase MoaA [Rhodocyclaceae bacterium]|nr:MAG: GTP 3',8-cyclase MoaA [Rhodocyclaceae bacterium]
MNDRIDPDLLMPPVPLRDSRGRELRDLRISITDRCNFRCTYCMPKEVFDADYPYLPRTDLLSFEEIETVARLAVAAGVNKIRLTGGEPLLRRGMEKLVAALAKIPGIDLALTTNGSLLAKKAQALRDAGLDRITVSLDGLDEAVFQRMNDVDFPVAQVLEGIAAAEAAGFANIKINVVVQKGVNEGEILPIVRHFRGSGHVPRFIEFMDVGSSNGWRMDQVLPSAQVLDMIDAEFPIEALGPHSAGEVAQRWRYRDGGGEVGVISSVTRAFCSTCTRLRLSTEGRFYTCLFAHEGFDLRALLRAGADEATLSAALEGLWTARADRYSELRADGKGRTVVPLKRIEMSYIGG